MSQAYPRVIAEVILNSNKSVESGLFSHETMQEGLDLSGDGCEGHPVVDESDGTQDDFREHVERTEEVDEQKDEVL